MNTYDVGDLVRGSASFTNAAGSAVDPDSVTFRWRHQDGAATVYTYGVGTVLVRAGTGSYYADFSAGTCGFYYYRFAATGTGQSAGEAKLFVRESNF